jgi:hypothetical protein
MRQFVQKILKAPFYIAHGGGAGQGLQGDGGTFRERV